MSTTIFTAKEYDPQKEHRRWQVIIAIASIVIILAGVGYLFRYWPYEHRVNQFFSAVENRDFKQAYGIWQNDPNWEQHPDKYKNYPFPEFYRDWGPSGEWGVISRHKIDGAGTPKGGSSGVIVLVTINGRVDPARLWVEKKDKTMTWSPY
jgi:hypothetical protein